MNIMRKISGNEKVNLVLLIELNFIVLAREYNNVISGEVYHRCLRYMDKYIGCDFEMTS